MPRWCNCHRQATLRWKQLGSTRLAHGDGSEYNAKVLGPTLEPMRAVLRQEEDKFGAYASDAQQDSLTTYFEQNNANHALHCLHYIAHTPHPKHQQYTDFPLFFMTI